MDSTLFNLLLGIVSIVISVGGVYLINFLNNKIGAEKTKHYYDLAQKVVMSIEQSNPQLAGIDKKELALNRLVELSDNKITKKQADTLIEAAVYDIKKLLKNNIK
ncbi:phage holin, LLH family [[Clostridium] dakarense]|uniref:phage holin, LLH family n=1 Tax=Faecalimicrobium dakarense TaxID=1301100 RepID=UPI0004ADA73B|nr:phage holin, LLH family [[Clostridium] dakarense]